MPQNTTFGYTDTNEANPLSIGSVPKLAYSTDFICTESGNGAAVLSNITSPMGWPETLRFSIQDVNNIYTGSGIDPVLYSPQKKGRSVVASVKDVAKKVVGTDVYMYPISAHTVVKYPVTDQVSVDDVMSVVKRDFALFFDGADSNSRLNQLIHGGVNPIQS